MKKVSLLSAVCLLWAFAYPQTEKQRKLTVDFFTYNGTTVINAFAHPTCTAYYSSIESYSGHTYYVKQYYKYGSESIGYFSCEYKIRLDYLGNFISFETYKCGSPDAVCFGACNFFRDLAAITTSEDKDRYEKYLHKVLDEFTCEDYCHARLYYKWIDLGYFRMY
jgi:hypothetical protein